MSLSVMKWVWENSSTKGSERLVILALVDFADDEGVCWPSIATVAKKANLDGRYVKRILKKLVSDGIIKVDHRKNGIHNRSNIFTIVMKCMSLPSETPGSGLEDTRGSGQETPRVVAPAPPESPINNQLDPSRILKPAYKKRRSAVEAPLFPIAVALSEVSGLSFEANKAKIFREAKELSRDPTATPDKIRQDYGPGGLWYQADWRGQRGQAPALTQVRSTWGTLKVNVTKPKSEPKGFAAIRDYIRQEGIKND